MNSVNTIDSVGMVRRIVDILTKLGFTMDESWDNHGIEFIQLSLRNVTIKIEVDNN